LSNSENKEPTLNLDILMWWG